LGALIFYFTNKSQFSMASFTTTLDNRSSETLKTDIKGLPDTSIAPESQTQQTIMFECKNVFIDPPTIRISYLAGALQGLTLQLPVLLHKYMEGAELSAEDFFKRWKQIGGAPREHQSIFGLVNKNRTMDSDFVQKVVKGFKWGIVTGVDPNVKNIVGATVLHSSEGKFGCLLRLEPNFETQVRDDDDADFIRYLSKGA
jgi:AP-2 complex subunit alpha